MVLSTRIQPINSTFFRPTPPPSPALQLLPDGLSGIHVVIPMGAMFVHTYIQRMLSIPRRILAPRRVYLLPSSISRRSHAPNRLAKYSSLSQTVQRSTITKRASCSPLNSLPSSSLPVPSVSVSLLCAAALAASLTARSARLPYFSKPLLPP